MLIMRLIRCSLEDVPPEGGFVRVDAVFLSSSSVSLEDAVNLPWFCIMWEVVDGKALYYKGSA